MLIATLPIHFLTTVTVGIVVGSFFHNYVGSARGLGEFDSWEFAFDRYESGEVVVRTDSGREVHGQVVNQAQIDKGEGVLLTDSSAADAEDKEEVEAMFSEDTEPRIRRWSGGEKEGNSLGDVYLDESNVQYTYFSRKDIETVFFLDDFVDDPNIPEKDPNDRAQEFCAQVGEQLNPTTLTVPTIGKPTYVIFLLLSLAISVAGSLWLLPETAIRTEVGQEQTVLFLAAGIASASAVLLLAETNTQVTRSWSAFVVLIMAFASPLVVSIVLKQPLMGVQLFGGAMVGLIVSSLYTHSAREYGSRPVMYMTYSLISLAVLSHTLLFGVWGQSVEQLAAVGVIVGLIALLLNRLRIGDAERFDRWDEVASEGVVWFISALVVVNISIPAKTIYTIPVAVYNGGSLFIGVVFAVSVVWRANEL